MRRRVSRQCIVANQGNITVTTSDDIVSIPVEEWTKCAINEVIIAVSALVDARCDVDVGAVGCHRRLLPAIVGRVAQ